MNSTQTPCLIGVDGGGTSCRVALVAGDRRFEVTLGPANASTDRVGAIATVRDGIARVAAQAGLGDAAGDLARVHVALAGIKSQADAQAVADGIGMPHLKVSEDQISSLCGALGEQDGFVAAIGTGSFLARQTGGQRQYIGGWGLDLGDEASGAWLGRGLLAAALRARDRVSEGSPLCEVILARFGDAAGIVEFVADAGPAKIATLAPLIVEHAQQGDGVARGLIMQGAEYIGQGLAALGYEPGNAVSFTGGLREVYVPWLTRSIQNDVQDRLGDALDGALFLAGQIEIRA